MVVEDICKTKDQLLGELTALRQHLAELEGLGVGSVIIGRDLTEQKQMQERLMIADRLASIGELVSEVAHELEAPLASIIRFAELLLEEEVSDEAREEIAIICHEAQRATDVIRNLRTFARRHKPSRCSVSINGVIATVLALRAHEQKLNNIKVDTCFAPDLLQVMADEFQLQQAFLNIIVNAEYFMERSHGRGTLTITTQRVGSSIRAVFADDGPGISEENLERLFATFFTTKDAGEGTGLGLSICHRVVTEHGGRIYAQSEPGKGATFIVELPVGTDSVVPDEELWVQFK